MGEQGSDSGPLCCSPLKLDYRSGSPPTALCGCCYGKIFLVTMEEKCLVSMVAKFLFAMEKNLVAIAYSRKYLISMEETFLAVMVHQNIYGWWHNSE